MSFPLVLGSHHVHMLWIRVPLEGDVQTFKRLTPEEHLPDFNSLFYMPALRNRLFNLL